MEIAAANQMQRNLQTFRQFAEKNPAFSQSSLRNLTQRFKTFRGLIEGNGLDFALIRLGRKVLIDESRFFVWVDEQQK